MGAIKDTENNKSPILSELLRIIALTLSVLFSNQIQSATTADSQKYKLMHLGEVGTSVPVSPYIDCERAPTLIEWAICSDRRIAVLDASLMQLYKVETSHSANKDALILEHSNWNTNIRDKCQDTGCLGMVYNDRIAELRNNVAIKDHGQSTEHQVTTDLEEPSGISAPSAGIVQQSPQQNVQQNLVGVITQSSNVDKNLSVDSEQSAITGKLPETMKKAEQGNSTAEIRPSSLALTWHQKSQIEVITSKRKN